MIFFDWLLTLIACGLGLYLVIGFIYVLFDIESPFLRYSKYRFFKTLQKNRIHNFDGLLDHVLSRSANEWTWQHVDCIETTLFPHSKRPIVVKFDAHYRPGTKLTFSSKGDNCAVIAFSPDISPNRVEMCSYFHDTWETETNAKWQVVLQHLFSISNTLCQTRKRQEEHNKKQEEQTRSQHLQSWQQTLARYLDNSITDEQRWEEPFRLVRNHFSASHITTLTVSFEQHTFYTATLEKGTFHEEWHCPNHDFHAPFYSLSDAMQTFAMHTLSKQASPVSMPTHDADIPSSSFVALLQKMNEFAQEKEWLSETEHHLLVHTYPDDLKRLQTLVSSASNSPSIAHHIEESLLSITETLASIEVSIEMRKEQAIIQQKRVIQARET